MTSRRRPAFRYLAPLASVATVAAVVAATRAPAMLRAADTRADGSPARTTVPVRLVPTVAPPVAPAPIPGEGDIAPEVHVPSDVGDVDSIAAVGTRAGFQPLVPAYVPPGLAGPFVHFENGNGDERLRDLVNATWTGSGGATLRLLQSRSRTYAETGVVESDPRNPNVTTTAITVNGANGYRRVGTIGDKTLVLVVLFRDGLRIEVFAERVPVEQVDAFVAGL